MESESESELESASRPKRSRKAKMGKERSIVCGKSGHQAHQCWWNNQHQQGSQSQQSSQNLIMSSPLAVIVSQALQAEMLRQFKSAKSRSNSCSGQFHLLVILTDHFDAVAEQVHRSVIWRAQLLRLKDCLQYLRVSSGPTQTLQPDQLRGFQDLRSAAQQLQHQSQSQASTH